MTIWLAPPIHHLWMNERQALVLAAGFESEAALKVRLAMADAFLFLRTILQDQKMRLLLTQPVWVAPAALRSGRATKTVAI